MRTLTRAYRPATPGQANRRPEFVTHKSVLTMSFIIGPLSGALVAGGVWPLIVYRLLRTVVPDKILDLLWLF